MIRSIHAVLKVFDKHKLFEEGVELIGSWCFKLYQIHLGAREFPLLTQDIDFLIPNPYPGTEHATFIDDLEELGFQKDFNRDGSIYLWNADLKIEFLTLEKSAGSDRALTIKKLGIRAVPLRYVGFLLKDSIMIGDNNIPIRIPRPSRFCLHKLIVASQRRKLDKRLKDLQQALCTSVIVNHKELRDLFDALPKKWRQTIIQILGKASQELPLLSEEAINLQLTLQK